MSKLLQGYEIEAQLCKGLYRARRGGARFAVKTFEVEPPAAAASAGRLSGPWVAEVREVGMLDTRPALVSDWVDGVSLARVVASGLSQPLALHVSFHVARAVTAAHELDDGALLHGALDLTHVLCGLNGAVKVINFGGGSTRRRRLRAQPGFVAPEVLGGECADVLSDVYACGAIAHLLLTGKTPAEAALTGSSWPALDVGLEEALARLLADDPADRAISPRVLTAAIDRFTEELDLELDGEELAAKVASLS